MTPTKLLQDLYFSALAAVDPARCVPPHLPPPSSLHPTGRTLVVGAGKAAAAMAKAVEDHWRGPLEGLVVTSYGHGVDCRWIEVVEAAHPVPDRAGLAAARRIDQMVRGLTPRDLVLFLGSGGGSSLLTCPAPPITLQDKQAVTGALLKCGAAIGEINCVRKHLSAIKGGRLALAAAPASVLALLVSDVAGDDPAVIASGPTVSDPSTRQDAQWVLKKYRISVPANVEHWLDDPASETPKSDHPHFAQTQTRIVARAKDALDAAARAATAMGIKPIVLGDAVEGAAGAVAERHAHAALDIAKSGVSAPCVLLSGGELTVAVTGNGRGGRNSEYLLALALALGGAPSIWALACDTDGIDGSEDNAGAFLTPDALGCAMARGMKAAEFLADNNAYEFFDALDALIRTGPTRTNVSDFRAILIDPAGSIPTGPF